MGDMTKIIISYQFGQKYTKGELNDPTLAPADPMPSAVVLNPVGNNSLV